MGRRVGRWINKDSICISYAFSGGKTKGRATILVILVHIYIKCAYVFYLQDSSAEFFLNAENIPTEGFSGFFLEVEATHISYTLVWHNIFSIK